MSKRRKMALAGAAVGGLILLALMLFLLGGKKPAAQGKAVPAVNRGLMQAETIRMQKDQLDAKNRNRQEEQEWVKRMQALRTHPDLTGETGRDMMPGGGWKGGEPTRNPMADAVVDPAADPVALYPDGRPDPADGPSQGSLADVRPSHPQEYAGAGWKNPFSGSGRAGAGAGVGAAGGGSSGDAEAGSPQMRRPAAFEADSGLALRMSDAYQKALAFNASEQLVFTRDRSERETERGAATAPAPKGMALQGSHVVVSAGQELTAVLTEALDSDYPSVAKATLTSPPELVGATVLLSYALGQERVSAQVLKMILPARDGERAREQTLAAVVKSGLPGLGGDVSHHWLPQIAAGVANAGLTAGALAYAAQNQSKDLGTAVLVAPMVEQSIQGVMKPINYLGRDRPVTVKVPAGTEFKLLVTEGFEVDL